MRGLTPAFNTTLNCFHITEKAPPPLLVPRGTAANKNVDDDGNMRRGTRGRQDQYPTSSGTWKTTHAIWDGPIPLIVIDEEE
jgi:hypothetical protein